MSIPKLILFGKQGAGKGTQAQLLVSEYKIVHLSTGDIFRAAIRAATPAGKEAKSFMDQGQLVPDDVTIKVVEEKFNNDEKLLKTGFVLDGFPRTGVQAEALEKILKEHDAPLSCAINLNVDSDIVLERLTGRRVCVECGTIYNVKAPPSRLWVCDVCGGDVRQRADDSELAIKTRLALYEKETAPLLTFYKDRNLLEEVDGFGDTDEVFARLKAVVDKHI